jgi:hypothetical protein
MSGLRIAHFDTRRWLGIMSGPRGVGGHSEGKKLRPKSKDERFRDTGIGRTDKKCGAPSRTLSAPSFKVNG